MRALALRLEGPMQSWGGPVAGDDRPSLDVPTKSGVLGLVASALGIGRGEVERLRALHAGIAVAVRVDRRGSVGVDYQTIGAAYADAEAELRVPTVDGNRRKAPIVSKRRYLYDASFTALLVERASASESLDDIARALREPAFAPFLGRRACPPSVPLLSRAAAPFECGALDEALAAVPPRAARADEPPYEVHADAELAPHASSRPRRQRDVLLGRLPRLFAERDVHVFFWSPRTPAPCTSPA